MAANNISIYFKVDTASFGQQDTWVRIAKLGEGSLGEVEGEPTEVPMGGPHDKLLVFRSKNNSHASVRVYSHGLITLDIQHYIKDDSFNPNNLAYIRALEVQLKQSLGDACTESNSIYCPLKRGGPVWPYAVTADERILEYDYDEVLVNSDSRWQNIRIMHSKQFGNVLLLDGDSMLGESDLIYTRTVCGLGTEDYRDKTVLILGGGDGGILHELLKEAPRFITMAEIDEEVVKACRTHMRSVCGSDMDEFKGPHHEIIIVDCVSYLHKCIQEGVTFDYVINDLTEFPVDKAVKGYGYDLETTSLITELSLKAVKKGGKLLARGNCLTAFDYRQKFENDVTTMGCDFLRKVVFVPSFEENYCLYEIWRKGELEQVKENGDNGH